MTGQEKQADETGGQDRVEGPGAPHGLVLPTRRITHAQARLTVGPVTAARARLGVLGLAPVVVLVLGQFPHGYALPRAVAPAARAAPLIASPHRSMKFSTRRSADLASAYLD